MEMGVDLMRERNEGEERVQRGRWEEREGES